MKVGLENITINKANGAYNLDIVYFGWRIQYRNIIYDQKAGNHTSYWCGATKRYHDTLQEAKTELIKYCNDELLPSLSRRK